MSEFMAATSEPARYATQRRARPDYISIGRDGTRAAKFFEKLCITQQAVINCAISCIIDLRIYNGVSSLLDLRARVPPYALGARTCMAHLHKWEEQFAIQSPVECIFETGDLEQNKFTALVVDEGGSAPIYKDKKDYAGLQAVDHYAWEQFYYLRKQRTGQHLPARESFKFLLNFIPCIHTEVTQYGLIDFCHKKGIDPRTGVTKNN